MMIKRLKIFILIFCLALSIPLAYFVLKTYRGLEQEEVATLSYFAETIFDEIERALAEIVQREEGRAIDEYSRYISPSGQAPGSGGLQPSPLSRSSAENFILGYFQNNPDGSFQTPLVENDQPVATEREDLLSELQRANDRFNRQRTTGTDKIKPPPAESVAGKEPEQKAGFADKYLDRSRTEQSKAYLGQKEKRLEKITVSQALNVAKQEQPELMSSPRAADESGDLKAERESAKSQVAGQAMAPAVTQMQESQAETSAGFIQPGPMADADEMAGLQVEVAPLQAVFLNDSQIFIFRRIMINDQIYRQGFVLLAKAFLEHLTQTYFLTQPMAQFTGLRMKIVDQGHVAEALEAGLIAENASFTLNRDFPSPFSFLKATLTSAQIPRAASRGTLNIMLIILAVIVLLGLFAIYQSARTIVDLSERRAQFVSSVTHELKTPLTNIRMYIEMLEQGIAQSPEREQEYFRILDSEGARLSRLINNVLELSKLEKRQRHVDLQVGTFEEVIEEVRSVMAEKIRQEGFRFNVEQGRIQPFAYDREVMVQVLINLIENSLKFGNNASLKEIRVHTRQEGGQVNIMVSDTGPGIPRHALKKIFDEFYRADNSLTRTTRGTGIGLALVKKFVQLMGGTVTAANNDGPGCTITISLPAVS